MGFELWYYPLLMEVRDLRSMRCAASIATATASRHMTSPGLRCVHLTESKIFCSEFSRNDHLTLSCPEVHGWPREAATTCEGRSRGGRLPKLGSEQGPTCRNLCSALSLLMHRKTCVHKQTGPQTSRILAHAPDVSISELRTPRLHFRRHDFSLGAAEGYSFR